MAVDYFSLTMLIVFIAVIYDCGILILSSLQLQLEVLSGTRIIGVRLRVLLKWKKRLSKNKIRWFLLGSCSLCIGFILWCAFSAWCLL